jgi:hypothetical protein
MADSPSVFIKDPQATLDYSVDWTLWLASGDYISSVVWTVPSGLTTVTTSNTNTLATIWLSGGTVGQSYSVQCKITTAGGRIDERTISIIVRQR